MVSQLRVGKHVENAEIARKLEEVVDLRSKRNYTALYSNTATPDSNSGASTNFKDGALIS